jgi:DNA-binding response OmpR family regulator
MQTPAQRILIVDDEEALLFGFSRMFKSPLTAVDTTQTVDSAKSLLKKRNYSIIISDLMLSPAPQIEGFEIIQYAKETQPDSKIIIITAYGGNDTKKQVQSLGVDYYFEKPVSPSKIKKILNLH